MFNRQFQVLNLKRGFTLIELMVVLTIIAALVAFTLTAFEATKKTSRDGRRKADLEQIRSALEMYRADKGYYPGGGGWCSQISYPSDPAIRNALVPNYMGSIPQDPLYANTYQDYFYRQPCCPPIIGKYELYAELETSDDNIFDDSGCVHIGGSNLYDYKVTNP